MGAGKSTIGEEVAHRLGRRFVDVDRELEAQAAVSVSELFATRGEAEFRVLEQRVSRDQLISGEPAVIALGGGALGSEATRRLLRSQALTVLVPVDVDKAWRRSKDSNRPLAGSEERFRALFEQRRPVYEAVADATATDADDVVLAAGGVEIRLGLLEELGSLIPGEGAVALVADAHVLGIYGAVAQLALGSRLQSTHTVPAGEQAKTLGACQRLWRELTLDRAGSTVALGGGCTTDVAGFVAATYLRGVDWVPVPTTLVGQVDAALGGKTAVDLPAGKNLVGAFYWPVRTLVDPALLETLPEEERKAGLAEVVKTGLLAGESLWELPDPELVRRCAAFKIEVCLRDPEDRGERAMLNLGHTFAHALEAASDHVLAHGEAVALGLTAALRLSGLEQEARRVEELLRPTPARVDPERAWSALLRDKKRSGSEPRLVLLEAPGKPLLDVELPSREVRRALEALIA
ncbi:MAG: 3-dehydroquinate synthase [Candidatus Rokuibacteriota bacterium]|nr:MAG: 3-dehydroquinate synthase [Candidatus Rokubacteria bacterium]